MCRVVILFVVVTAFTMNIFAANGTIQEQTPLALQPDPTGSGRISQKAVSRGIDEWLNIRVNSDETGQVQNEQQIAANPTDPENIIAVWRDFRLGYRRVGIGYSFDGGYTWVDDLFYDPNFDKQSDPGLTYHSSGRVYAVNLSFDDFGGGDGIMVAWTDDGGVSWSDWVAAVSNYDPDLFEDKELMACDRSGSQYDGNLYIVWSRFEYNPYQTTITLVRSTTGGMSWDEPVAVGDEHGVQWPVPAVGPDGQVYVAWVKYYDTSIRFDRSFDGGQTWGDDIIVQETAFADKEIYPELRIFSFPAMDVDITNGLNRGNIYIAYTDSIYTDHDIFFTASRNQGITWSDPIRVNDDEINNGADQFHPWLVCDETGMLHLIFYDRRNDLPQNLYIDLYYTHSSDAGLTWAPNERITTVSSNPALDSLDSGLIGEYNGLAVMNGIIHPIWTDTRNGHQDSYTAVWDTSSAAPGEQQSSFLPVNSSMTVAPNPFNDALEVRLELTKSEEVEIAIFDLQGREVKGLVEDRLPAGLSRRIWQPSGPSGIYFIQARSSEWIAVKKVIYLK